MGAGWENAVVVGRARFSALGTGLVRLEWSPDGMFEDRPTAKAIDRPLPVAFVAQGEEDGAVVLATEHLRIVYRPAEAFDESNLSIAWAAGGLSGVWNPAAVDVHNLGGTFTSLDLVHRHFLPEGVHPAKLGENYRHASRWLYSAMRRYHRELQAKGEKTNFEEPPLWYVAGHRREEFSEELQEFFSHWDRLPPGVLSRSGWAVIDDSDGAAVDPESGFPAARRGNGGQDWYFFAYGHDYRRALADFVTVFGRIPQLPDWAFGPWFSLFDDLHDRDYRELVEKFEAHGLPLSVVVFDVDWHDHGWCGWDWNRELIPDPPGLIGWMHGRGLHTAANVHIEGVPPQDSQFANLCRDLGHDPEAVRRGEVFDVRNPMAEWTFDAWQPDDTGSYKPTEEALKEGWLIVNLAHRNEADGFMHRLHAPRQDDGIDFWWIDGESARFSGLNDQLWTNHVYFSHLQNRSDRRALILSRTGGIGSHRTPVQFSADTYSHWEVLRFLVDFTARAGNVGVAYWSHDLGGFYGHALGVPTLDPELFVRWVQFGCWSPIVRMHSDHGRREPWAYGRWVLEALRKALRTRSTLVPYLAHLGRVAHESGLPLCRPLYLAWPDREEAYTHPDQYLLGDGVLVAPVVEPGGLRHLWLPPGEWWSWQGDAQWSGDRPLTLRARLDEVPVFVAAGTIVPLAEPNLRPGLAPPDPLVFALWAGEGEIDFRQDDGCTVAGGTARRRLRQTRQTGSFLLMCDPCEGRWPGQPERQRVRLLWHGVSQEARVEVEGALLAGITDAGAALVVDLEEVPADSGWRVVIHPQ